MCVSQWEGLLVTILQSTYAALLLSQNKLSNMISGNSDVTTFSFSILKLENISKLAAKARFPLPELTRDRFPLPVNTARVQCWASYFKKLLVTFTKK